MKAKQTKDYPETFYAYIEIQKGSGTKYEYSEELENLVLDRYMFTSMVYPANYGSVIATRGKDGDPLDVIVYSPAIVNGAIIRCRPIGILNMTDEAGSDDKILAVPVEKVYAESAAIQDITDMSEHEKAELKHFFEHMKELEKGKFVKVEGFGGKAEAIKVLKASKK